MNYTEPVVGALVGKFKKPDPKRIAEMKARRAFYEAHKITVSVDPITKVGHVIAIKKNVQR